MRKTIQVCVYNTIILINQRHKNKLVAKDFQFVTIIRAIIFSTIHEFYNKILKITKIIWKKSLKVDTYSILKSAIHEFLYTCWPPRPGVVASFICETGDPNCGIFMAGDPAITFAPWVTAVFVSGGKWPVDATVTISKCVFYTIKKKKFGY